MIGEEKVNILMVDDQPGKLLSYEAILNELGENLIAANSGREALESLLKNDIAVVLMDVSMPEIDGFELAEMIRQHPRFQKTAIIFISAVHLTDLDRLKGYQRGAVDYISVPVVPELLRARVSVFAELYRKTKQLELLNGELRRLSKNLIAAQDQERRRVARELHDGLGQDLAAAKMILEGIQPEAPAQTNGNGSVVVEVGGLIDRAIQQVRSMSHLLHPPLLDEVGLQSALQWYVEGFAKRSGIATSIDIQPADFPRFGPELETAIFRIIQEALTNVFRHSGARKASVTVVLEEQQVIGIVHDEGNGISDDIAAFRSDNIGVGLGGMRQRVKELGGELTIHNALPGTIVKVKIPTELTLHLDTSPEVPEARENTA